MFCTKFGKQNETFIKCMCRKKMYIRYIFVRIVIESYFWLLCVKMLHCVYLKNGVSGERYIVRNNEYICNIFSMDFYSDELNLCFLYSKLLLPFLYLELALSVVVS